MTSQIQAVKLRLIEELRSQKFDFNKLRCLLHEPDYIIATGLALCFLGDGTAEQIAEKMGILRANASDYLNQLARNGHAKKYRKGREVYFKQLFNIYM